MYCKVLVFQPIDHVSVSLTHGIGPTQGQRKTLTRVVIKPEGRGFNFHLGQSFPLSLCGPNSICRANAHMVYGLKHQHFTLHYITLFVLNTSATRPYVANTTFLIVTFQYCYHVS